MYLEESWLRPTFPTSANGRPTLLALLVWDALRDVLDEQAARANRRTSIQKSNLSLNATDALFHRAHWLSNRELMMVLHPERRAELEHGSHSFDEVKHIRGAKSRRSHKLNKLQQYAIRLHDAKILEPGTAELGWAHALIYAAGLEYAGPLDPKQTRHGTWTSQRRDAAIVSVLENVIRLSNEQIIRAGKDSATEQIHRILGVEAELHGTFSDGCDEQHDRDGQVNGASRDNQQVWNRPALAEEESANL